MAVANQHAERRTNVDGIFEHLHNEIISLRLRPGDKISEADIAARFDVSRQPVRDAFSRLANLDLLLIRPQRATEVKRFSHREIVKSRFVRASVEREVLRLAATHCTAKDAAKFKASLAEQKKAIKKGDTESFGELDYKFHELLCHVGKVEFAFDVIMTEKSKLDRLCMLSLEKENRMPQLLDDHRAIAEAVIAHDAQAAVEHGVVHLSRLDETIEQISVTNAQYFEQEN